MPPDGEQEDAHYLGHRERLRERFLTAGPDSLQDYEMIEVLLWPIPRRDTKPMAKKLLEEFGDLWGIVNAPQDRLKAHGLTDAAMTSILMVGAAALRMARQRIMDKPVLSSWQLVIDYCMGAMALEPVEHFRLLFLDRRHTLIADEVQQRGTIDHTPVYPREVIKRAIALGATAVVLVHNHPTGDPTPSRADIDMTREIMRCGQPLGIAVHDHLIVSKGGYVSFKTRQLI
jgi:DNA repair protein RadC